jgi:hypothetical protein
MNLKVPKGTVREKLGRMDWYVNAMGTQHSLIYFFLGLEMPFLFLPSRMSLLSSNVPNSFHAAF